MITFFILTYHIMFHVMPAAHGKPHAQQQIARDLEVDGSNLHVIQRWSALPWGIAVGLKVSARCSDAIRCISCELQLCCCIAGVCGGTAVGALLPISLSGNLKIVWVLT